MIEKRMMEIVYVRKYCIERHDKGTKRIEKCEDSTLKIELFLFPREMFSMIPYSSYYVRNILNFFFSNFILFTNNKNFDYFFGLLRQKDNVRWMNNILQQIVLKICFYDE